MKITDAQAQELRYQWLSETGEELPLEEARDSLARMLVLLERFSAWIAKEKARGRMFPLDEHPPAP